MNTDGWILKCFRRSMWMRPSFKFLASRAVHETVSRHFLTTVKNDCIVILLMFNHAWRHWSVVSHFRPGDRSLLSGSGSFLFPLILALECCTLIESESFRECSGKPLTSKTNLENMCWAGVETLSGHGHGMLHESIRCLVKSAESGAAFLTSGGRE